MRVVFLGIAGSAPARGHNAPSILVEDYLLDCGEGATRALAELGALRKVRKILVTHVHADHFSGLPSLLWTLALVGVEGELLIAGPEGVERATLEALELMRAPLHKLESRLYFEELKPGEELGPVKTAGALHSIPSLAYRIDVDSSICYTGDTAPSEEVTELARECELLVHDSTFPPGEEERGAKLGHSTPRAAGEVGERAGARALALFHLPFYYFEGEEFVEEYLRAASSVFRGEVFVPEELRVYEI